MNRHLTRILAVLILIAGATMFIYPTLAAWNSQRIQSGLINAYGKEIQHVVPDAQQQLKAAHEYNDALSAGADVGAWQNVATGDAAAARAKTAGKWDYSKLLRADDMGTMARIRIPKIKVDLPIYHGSSQETLLRGAGHLEGTSLPVGGKGTRTVITAHRGLAQARMFTDLDKVTKGDIFYIETFGQTLAYKVIEIQVVEPDQSRAIKADPNKDLATLVTCTPLGINSHRILVTGERTTLPANQSAGKTSEVPPLPWQLAVYIGVIIGSIVMIIREIIAWRHDSQLLRPKHLRAK